MKKIHFMQRYKNEIKIVTFKSYVFFLHAMACSFAQCSFGSLIKITLKPIRYFSTSFKRYFTKKNSRKLLDTENIVKMRGRVCV